MTSVINLTWENNFWIILCTRIFAKNVANSWTRIKGLRGIFQHQALRNRRVNFANLLLRGTWPFLRGEDTILSFLLSFLSSSRFSRASSWAIRLSASARVARRHTISSLCAKDCLSRSATLPKRDPVSHSSISSVKEDRYLPSIAKTRFGSKGRFALLLLRVDPRPIPFNPSIGISQNFFVITVNC